MMTKRALLATTALASFISFSAAPAHAELQLSVGGFMEQFFGYAEGAGKDNHGFDEQSDAEIIFEGQTTLDNGLEFGINIQLEAQTDGDQIDQQYAYVESNFGRLELGSNNSAPFLMSIGVPSAGAGLDSGDAPDWIGGVNGDLITTTFNFSRDEDSAEKLNYFTPRFYGLQLGAVYVPELEEDVDNNPDENNGLRDNAFGFAANYDRDYGDFSFGASAGYMHYGDDDALAGDAPENIGFGISLGYAGFTVAGAYNDLEDSVSGDLETMGVGIVYETGPVAVSFGYIYGDDKNSQADSNAFELGGSYTLGPGIALTGSVFYVNQDSPFGAELEGAAALGGIALNF